MKTPHLALLAILFAAPLCAQTAKFQGKTLDSSGGVITGASITVLDDANMPVANTMTKADGTFEVQLPAGSYQLDIAANGFEQYLQPIQVTPNAPPVSITLALAKVTQEVEVQEQPNLITLDPDNNLTSTVLDEKLVEQLPDDPDELTQYLTDLAGPRANATGGVDFIIDGFTNGILPAKEQILQIRINNNPFSSEYVRPGFGRIEIITKPGTGSYHGMAQFSGRSDALDANPNYCAGIAATNGCAARPPYQRKFFISNISGPIIKNRATASLNIQHQDNDPSTAIVALNPLTGLPINGFITSPSAFDNYNTRGQWSITPNQAHVLNYNVQYQSRSASNLGVGGIGLVTLPGGVTSFNGYSVNNAYSSRTRNEEIQIRETEIISSKMVHELRFEWDHNSQNLIPAVMTGPQYTINGALQFGSANNFQETRNTNIQFANALSYVSGIFTLKAGVQAEHFSNFQNSQQGFNGSYTFANFSAFQANQPQTYTIITGNPNIPAYQWTVGNFIQTDWKVSRKWLISGGARYTWQTNVSNPRAFDPRGGFNYQLTKSTVVRGGFGLFHQLLTVNTVNNLIQYDGLHQLQTILTDPTPDEIALANTGALAGGSQIYIRAPNLTTPYTIDTSLSIEQALKNGWVLTAAIDDIKGVHLYRGRDINAAPITPTCIGIIISGCVRPNPARGIMNQLESSADSRFDSLTLGFRERFKTLNVFGYYTFSRNLSDTLGPNILPSNNYDLRADWGYSPQQVRNRVQTTLNYTMPRGVLVFVNAVWRTGNPYNQVLNSPGEDGKYNQRLPGVPINSFTGPQNLNVGFNVNKTFMLREATGPANPNQNNRRQEGPGGRGRIGGPPPAGGFRGGPGPARGGGGGGGNPGGAPGLGPGGVSLTLFANTFNILNYTNLNNPSGVIGSPFYGIPTAKNNPRIVELGARINF